MMTITGHRQLSGTMQMSRLPSSVQELCSMLSRGCKHA